MGNPESSMHSTIGILSVHQLWHYSLKTVMGIKVLHKVYGHPLGYVFLSIVKKPGPFLVI